MERRHEELGLSEADLPASITVRPLVQWICGECGRLMASDLEDESVSCLNRNCRNHGLRAKMPFIDQTVMVLDRTTERKGPPLVLTSPPSPDR